MADYKTAKDFIKEQTGIITAKDFKNQGISFFLIKKLIEDYMIERVDKGIYIKTDEFEDTYYIFQSKISKAVFSYNTALYLLGKTEVIPERIDITIPSDYNAQRIDKSYTIHYVSKDFLTLGITEATTLFGNKVICYNLERTICDLVKNKNNGLDSEQVNKIIRNAFLYKQIDIALLYEYAKKLRCVKKIEMLTEVLL